MVEPEGDLADALFLHAHPGWSWRDLQDTPAQVVEYIAMIDYEIAKRAERAKR